MPTFLRADPLIAASLLTRVPVPVDHAQAAARAGAAAWAHPLVGAALGAATGLAFASVLALGLPALFAAAAAIALGLVLTGALHEDGLADCADGLGGTTASRRLEIMRDSRLGTFGGAALTLALVAKASLLAGFGGAGAVGALAIAGAVSRAFTAAALRWVPPARAQGLSASAGTPPVATVVAAIALALALAVALGGVPVAVRVLLAAGAAALAAHWLARRLIGGQTGDVLGAAQVLGEIAALAVLATP